MPKATEHHTTPRRALFRGTAVLLATAALPAACQSEAFAAPAGNDPVLALYSRYLYLEGIQAPVNERSDAIRARMVRQYGEPGKGRSANDLWEMDPELPDLRRLNDESDRLTSEITDAIEAMMDTPATSLAGILAKMRCCLQVWQPLQPADLQHHEAMALAFVQDAERLLGAEMANSARSGRV